MAQDPVSSLIQLNEATKMLDIAQARINSARVEYPSDQLWQLALDRRQSDVDSRRELIEELKLDISSRN